MKVRYLRKDEISDAIDELQYNYEPDERFLSRCMCASKISSMSTAPLSLPGGDIGELALLYASGRVYGFDVDYDKALECLSKLVGGKKSLSVCNTGTDEGASCDVLSHLFADPEHFQLDSESVAALKEHMRSITPLKKGKTGAVSPQASAALIYEGPAALQPLYRFESSEGAGELLVLTIHKSLADERHKRWSEVLVEEKAVKLYSGLDADYVYEVLSEMFDTMVLMILNRIDHRLPLYFVHHTPSGKRKIEEYSGVMYS